MLLFLEINGRAPQIGPASEVDAHVSRGFDVGVDRACAGVCLLALE